MADPTPLASLGLVRFGMILDADWVFSENYLVNVEAILQFIIGHNTLLIEILFGAVLLGLLYLSVRIFLSHESSTGGNVDLTGIEASLKKILESSKTSIGASDKISSADPVALEDMKAELSTLKEQINQRDQEITGLKSKLEGGGGGPVVSGDASKLEEQIRDLQAKLDEYSIIEDDIADLSFYKEETVRLQQELDKEKEEKEKLKLAASVAPVAASAPVTSVAAPATPVAAAPTLSAQDSIDSLLAAHQEDSQGIPDASNVARMVSPDPAKEEKAADPFDIIDNDLMAEFQAAVEAQKAASQAATTAKQAARDLKAEQKLAQEAAQKVAHEATQEAIQAVASQTPVDEFAAAQAAIEAAAQTVAVEPAAAEPSLELPNVDLDKMLNEAQGLQNVELIDAPNAIEQSLDTDKLLDEANLMGSDESKLLSEFDNFVKKEG